MPDILSGLPAADAIGLPKTPTTPGGYRGFGDSGAIRQHIYNNALEAAASLGKNEPIRNNLHSMQFSDVHYADPDTFSLQRQKEAILKGDSLARRIRGTVSLMDNTTGQTLDKRVMTIAHIPHMTDRGTFIINGNEWSLAHQLRLRPGIYTRVQENGEIESHVNAIPGKGASHHYNLNPATGVFQIEIGQAKMPLIAVLKALGTTDKELRDAWGNEIFQRNQPKDSPHILDKLYERLVRRGDPNATTENKREAVAKMLQETSMDPEVTKRTLGKPFQTLTKEAILATTHKLLAVNRREAEPDDRDNLAFQKVMGPEDLLAERIHKDRKTMRDLFWKASGKRSLDSVPPGFMTKAVHAAFITSGLGNQLEEINPSELFDQQTRVTRLGEGGIKNLRGVPEDARNVQPSHFGFIDIIRSPESLKAGVESRFAYMARKGHDGTLHIPFRDPKTGKTLYKTPQDTADLTIAFPGELRRAQMGKSMTNDQGPVVSALRKGRVKYVSPKEVDYEIPEMEHTFSPLANMVPMKSAVKGQRVAMGSRMLAQALPLKYAEAPLVQSGMPEHPDKSYEEFYGEKMGAVFSKAGGKVMSVTPDYIKVRYDDGKVQTHELYNNFPYGRKTGIHNTALVGAGDRVNPGQILAKSNYTDHNGVTALGLNPKIAFMSYGGKNYEDAVLISESFAKKSASEHVYKHSLDNDSSIKTGKHIFVGVFPTKYDKKTLDTLDSNGVVKPGTIVKSGDPLIAAVREKEFSHSQIHRKRGPTFADATVTWDSDNDGIVTDVTPTKHGTSVTVKSYNPTTNADKFAGLYGNKGVVADIIKDEDMPRGEDGEPFEMLLNPLGVISRVNPASLIHTVLGKIAAKTGKPYKIQDFKNIDDLAEFAKSELDKHGMKDLETVTDPKTGRQIPGVLTGRQFIMKLHHTSESKSQGRGLGAYAADETPAKGGSEGSKRVAMMSTFALLSSGATDVLHDAHAIRGQKNTNYWRAFQSGQRPPEPEVPLVYRKFINHLRGAGINVVRKGTQMNIMPMVNKDVDKLCEGRFLKNADTVSWKEGEKPYPGGLFDPRLTGGHGGTNWSAIKLHEPMPSPIMEEPIRRLLGLTEQKFLDILAGKEELNGAKGPAAIYAGLSKINVPKAIEQARAEIKGSKKTAKDAAIRKLGYLYGCQKNGLKPTDWFLDKVPVIPPQLRPVSVMMSSGLPQVNDANHLYKEVWEANEGYKWAKGAKADPGFEALTLYKAFKGVTGLGDPVQPKNVEKDVSGLLHEVFGETAKFGTVQRKLLGSNVDITGRATITPNPDLDMDHVGLPEERAWTVYKPFIVRRLVKGGMGALEAATAVNNQSPTARNALLAEMEHRPVMLDRAPVLHRYGVMAFWPQITKGHTLQISPIVTKGFGADFDGDAMQYHVPASDAARDEAIFKMLPSRNLLSASKFKVHYLPQQEYVGGLYAATTHKDDKKPRVFRNKYDALAAYKRGEIGVGHPIEIIDHK